MKLTSKGAANDTYLFTRDAKLDPHVPTLLKAARDADAKSLSPLAHSEFERNLLRGELRELVKSGRLPGAELESLSRHLFYKSQDNLDPRNWFGKRTEHLRVLSTEIQSLAYEMVRGELKAP